MEQPQGRIAAIPLRQGVPVWTRIALLSFGGPAGQIAVMHRILVEEKRWIDEPRFLHALNFCMLLPGPEAQQLATYVGWLLHGRAGGFVAGTLFILPGFLAILALSILYAALGDTGPVAAALFGLKAAVLAIVVEAVQRIGRRALRDRIAVLVALAAFVAIFVFAVPFPVIVLAAGLAGAVLGRVVPGYGGGTPVATGALPRPQGSVGRSLRLLAVGLTLWWAPVAALAFSLGPSHVLVDAALFFSKAAVVTFGGAYAVLAYVGQQAVDVFGWLRPGEMLDGLGMAETTPGPLIMVLQFVGFLGAFRDPAPFTPLLAGVLGSLVTVWVTFVPCFLWIFLGAPWVEHLRGNRTLGASLTTITAAVVGVILNLAVWFGLHVLFRRSSEITVLGVPLRLPDPASVDVAAVAVAAVAFVTTFALHWSMPRTLALCVLLGLVLRGS